MVPTYAVETKSHPKALTENLTNHSLVLANNKAGQTNNRANAKLIGSK